MSMRTFAAGLWLVLVPVVPAWAQYPVTQLTGLSQQVVQAGTTIPCRCTTGQFLDDVDRLVFSHPLIQAEVVQAEAQPFAAGSQPRFGHFSVRVDAAVPAGWYECWAVGAFGVSNPLPFLVTDSPVTVLDDGHRDPAAAVSLDPGHWYQATFAAEQVQHYQIELQSQQTLRVQSLAGQLDSRALVHLRLDAPDGRTVADVIPVNQVDPVLEYTAEAAGTYHLEANEFLFRGGPNMVYALQATIDGKPVPQSQSIAALANDARAATNPSDTWPARLPPLRSVDSLSLAWEPHDLALEDHVESESPDGAAMAVDVPVRIHGSFESARADEDAFRFHAAKGSQWAIEVASQRLGQATDPILFVFAANAEGVADTAQLLAQQDDLAAVGTAAVRSAPQDAAVLFTAPHDGDFVVIVRDQFNHRAPHAPQDYLFSIAAPVPGYELFAYVPYGLEPEAQSQPTGIVLPRRGTTEVEVFAIRRQGFAHEIEVAAKDLPAGVSCRPMRIAANGNRTTLVFHADATAADDRLPLVIEGNVVGADDSAVRRAQAATIRGGPDAHQRTVTSRRSTTLMLAVGAQSPPPITAELAQGSEPLSLARGEKKTLPVSISRSAASAAPVVLRARHLPPGTSMADVTIPADQSAGTMELVVSDKAPVGTFDFWIQLDTTAKFEGGLARRQAAEKRVERLQRLQQLQPMLDGLDQAVEAATKQQQQIQEATKAFERKILRPVEAIRVEISEAPTEVPATDQS